MFIQTKNTNGWGLRTHTKSKNTNSMCIRRRFCLTIIILKNASGWDMITNCLVTHYTPTWPLTFVVWYRHFGRRRSLTLHMLMRKHTHKTKDRVTQTQLKTGGELRCTGKVSSSCSTSDTRHVTLVTNPVYQARTADRQIVRTDIIA